MDNLYKKYIFNNLWSGSIFINGGTSMGRNALLEHLNCGTGLDKLSKPYSVIGGDYGDEKISINYNNETDRVGDKFSIIVPGVHFDKLIEDIESAITGSKEVYSVKLDLVSTMDLSTVIDGAELYNLILIIKRDPEDVEFKITKQFYLSKANWVPQFNKNEPSIGWIQ